MCGCCPAPFAILTAERGTRTVNACGAGETRTETPVTPEQLEALIAYIDARAEAEAGAVEQDEAGFHRGNYAELAAAEQAGRALRAAFAATDRWVCQGCDGTGGPGKNCAGCGGTGRSKRAPAVTDVAP